MLCGQLKVAKNLKLVLYTLCCARSTKTYGGTNLTPWTKPITNHYDGTDWIQSSMTWNIITVKHLTNTYGGTNVDRIQLPTHAPMGEQH